jgi:adenylate cyclase class IV
VGRGGGVKVIIKDKKMFEVEVRCHFESAEEAYERLPFLRAPLKRTCDWETSIYGLKLFQSGQLLRTARVSYPHDTRYYLGWKGPDTGSFANIREEIDEEIGQAGESLILRRFGGGGRAGNLEETARELARLGQARFMSFEGTDSSGYYEAYGIKLKLMNCKDLRWPLIVEIEKTAESLEEAAVREEELKQICCQFHLDERLEREEPPTLLYEKRFPE